MDCKLTRDEWVAYHLGATDDATRDAIDAHLLTCPSCLRVFLGVKHQMQGAAASARPSDATRARIRRDVAAIVQMNKSAESDASSSRAPRRIPRFRAVLERRVPVYQAFMVAALFVGLAIGAPLAGSSLRQASAMRDHSEANVDTSRPYAQSLSIY